MRCREGVQGVLGPASRSVQSGDRGGAPWRVRLQRGVKRLSHRRPCPNPVSDCLPSTAGQYSVSSSYAALIHFGRGLKYVSKHRKERVTAIAAALAASDHDVITLQELWVFADYEYVRDAVSKRLPHSKFFYRCVCH